MSYASSTPAMAPSGNSIGLAASIRAFKRCALRAARCAASADYFMRWAGL